MFCARCQLVRQFTAGMSWQELPTVRLAIRDSRLTSWIPSRGSRRPVAGGTTVQWEIQHRDGSAAQSGSDFVLRPDGSSLSSHLDGWAFRNAIPTGE
jgi:hypothetical protein